jgi:hypothetical protein
MTSIYGIGAPVPVRIGDVVALADGEPFAVVHSIGAQYVTLNSLKRFRLKRRPFELLLVDRKSSE